MPLILSNEPTSLPSIKLYSWNVLRRTLMHLSFYPLLFLLIEPHSSMETSVIKTFSTPVCSIKPRSVSLPIFSSAQKQQWVSPSFLKLFLVFSQVTVCLPACLPPCLPVYLTACAVTFSLCLSLKCLAHSVVVPIVETFCLILCYRNEQRCLLHVDPNIAHFFICVEPLTQSLQVINSKI